MRARLEKYRLSLLSLLLLVVLLAVGGLPSSLATSNPDPSPGGELPLIGSYDHLLQLLESAQGQGDYYLERNILNMSKTSLETAGSTANDTAAPSSAVPDFSGTNLQVQGVDEGDLVKTDGSYIYQVNQDKVLIIKAQPADVMELVSTLEFADSGFSPVDLYLDAENLIVIGSYSPAVPISPAVNRIGAQIYPPLRSFQSTKAIIYNIAEKSQVRKIRELELEGSYLSSRKVGSNFYLLSNKYLDYYYIQQREGITPLWRDTVRGEAYVAEKLETIRYFPDCVSPNYLLTAALDLNSPTLPADIHSYLGSGDQVYASQQNLFVAVHRNDYPSRVGPMSALVYPPADSHTKIYKFALQPGKVQYAGAGQVPGRILNQFSMSISSIRT
jgi:inhibitor of cysteine peptidase